MKKLISLLAASSLLICTFAGCEDADSDFESRSSAITSQSDTTSEGTTETTTDKKTTKSVTTSKTVTTEAATTKEGSTKPSVINVPGTIGDDVTGKWAMDRDSILNLMDDGDMNGMEIRDAMIEFTDKGKMEVSFSMDVSSVMCLKDEKPLALYGEDISAALKDKSFFIGGINCPIYDFNGDSFRTGIRDNFYSFKRSAKSDNIYGEYELPENLGSGGENVDKASITFEKSGVCYISYLQSDDYIYDSKNGLLKNGADDENPVIVRFKDKDTLVIVDSDGEDSTLTRIK